LRRAGAAGRCAPRAWGGASPGSPDQRRGGGRGVGRGGAPRGAARGVRAPRLVRLINAAGGGARSAAERRMVALLREAGLGGWEANAEIRDRSGLIGYGDIVFAR